MFMISVFLPSYIILLLASFCLVLCTLPLICIGCHDCCGKSPPDVDGIVVTSLKWFIQQAYLHFFGTQN